jgi:predicted Zn-dependent peptidase
MSNLARQEMYHGRTFTMEEILRRLDGVTRGDVHRMAKRVFRPGTPALAAVGRTRALKAARAGFSL